MMGTGSPARRGGGIGLALLFASVGGIEAAGAHVAYGLRYASEEPGILSVEIAPGPLPLPQTLAIPRAIPMGYGEQPYDRFVFDV
jgi:hypothetical protein